MSRFLFCSLDSPGHLYPMIGIARELVSQGHEVAFVTDLRWKRFLEEQNLVRISRGTQDGSSFHLPQWADPFAVAIQVKHIEYALDRFPADVLVGQSLTLGPLIAAERRGLPTALLGFFTYLYPGRSFVTPKRQLSEEEARLAWRRSDMLKHFNAARALFRLQPFESDFDESPLLGDLFFLRTIPDLVDTGLGRLPDRVHVVGDCLWEPEGFDADLENWLSETDDLKLPLIYVQHGRFFNIPGFWPRLVEAFGGLRARYRIAASVGRMDSEVGDIPPNFFVRDHLPQSRVLQSACCLVASANTTAVLGAITAGIPSLLIPAGGEQPDVAHTCQRAGTARIVAPQEITPETIVREIDILLQDGQYHERAFELSTAFHQVNGPRMAGHLLTSLAGVPTHAFRLPLQPTEYTSV